MRRGTSLQSLWDSPAELKHNIEYERLKAHLEVEL